MIEVLKHEFNLIALNFFLKEFFEWEKQGLSVNG